MSQPHPLAPVQRRPTVTPGYETMSRSAYDAGMAARHEARVSGVKSAGRTMTELDRNRRLLELRRRQLALIALG